MQKHLETQRNVTFVNPPPQTEEQLTCLTDLCQEMNPVEGFLLPNLRSTYFTPPSGLKLTVRGSDAFASDLLMGTFLNGITIAEVSLGAEGWTEERAREAGETLRFVVPTGGGSPPRLEGDDAAHHGWSPSLCGSDPLVGLYSTTIITEDHIKTERYFILCRAGLPRDCHDDLQREFERMRIANARATEGASADYTYRDALGKGSCAERAREISRTNRHRIIELVASALELTLLAPGSGRVSKAQEPYRHGDLISSTDTNLDDFREALRAWPPSAPLTPFSTLPKDIAVKNGRLRGYALGSIYYNLHAVKPMDLARNLTEWEIPTPKIMPQPSALVPSVETEFDTFVADSKGNFHLFMGCAHTRTDARRGGVIVPSTYEIGFKVLSPWFADQARATGAMPWTNEAGDAYPVSFPFVMNPTHCCPERLRRKFCWPQGYDERGMILVGRKNLPPTQFYGQFDLRGRYLAEAAGKLLQEDAPEALTLVPESVFLPLRRTVE